MSMDGNLQKYKALLTAVDTGSITKAAETLSYTQSGISRMIGDLEDEWKVTLLERRHAGVRLTSDGMQLLPHIRAICSEAAQLEAAVDDLNGLKNGLIRIGTFHGTGALLAPLISGFRRKYPGIDFRIRTGEYADVEEWIASGSVDCGITRLPVQKDLETFFLLQDRFAAVLPADHKMAGEDVFPAASIEGETYLQQQTGSLTDVLELFDRCGIQPQSCLQIWEEADVPAMVESGLGVSILPMLAVGNHSSKAAVVPLDIPAYRNIGISLRSRKGSSLAVKRFLEYLQEM